MSRAAWLVEINAYDTVGASAEVLRYSDIGWTSGASDTPAHTPWRQRFDGFGVTRDMFSAGTTGGESRVGFGDIVLVNADGGLDDLMDYAFDGREVTVYYSDAPDVDEFPGHWTTVLVATMERAEFALGEVRLKLRDRQFETDIPLQSTLYAGDNSLPAGLEGVEDLKGKPKPLLFGQVRNVSPPLVNSAKLIYQLSDNALDSVEQVYDRGINLGRSVDDTEDVSSPFKTAGNSVRAFAYSEDLGRIVAVGANSMICTSDDDGETWTERTSHGFTGDVACVTWSPDDDLFVAGGDAGELETSPDGITWTSRTSNVSSEDIQGVAYGDGSYVIVANGGKVANSTNGVTWTARPVGHGTNTVNGAAYAPLEARGGSNTFVITGSAGKISYSIDGGVNWTNVSDPGFGVEAILTAGWLGDRLYASSSSGRTRVSDEGEVWTEWVGTWDSGDFIRQIDYAEGYFVAGGGSGLLAVSTNGQDYVKKPPKVSSATTVFTVLVTSDIVLLGLAGGFIHRTSSGVSTVSYASTSELLDNANAPVPGAYGVHLAGGYIRLGAKPAGEITVDATAGNTASDRTAGQIFTDMLEETGFTSSDWSTSDITALDSDNNAVCGIWIGTQEISLANALTRVAQSVGAWWGVDHLGIFRIQRLELPTGTSDASFTGSRFLDGPTWTPLRDRGGGIPAYRVIVRYDRNYSVQTSDLAAGVSEAHRADVAQEWKAESSTDASVQTAHVLSPELTVDTLLTTSSAASTEAGRLQTLRGSQRRRIEFVAPLDDVSRTLDLGDIATLTLDRYGLDSGVKFRVIHLEPNMQNNTIRIGVWG